MKSTITKTEKRRRAPRRNGAKVTVLLPESTLALLDEWCGDAISREAGIRRLLQHVLTTDPIPERSKVLI